MLSAAIRSDLVRVISCRFSPPISGLERPTRGAAQPDSLQKPEQIKSVAQTLRRVTRFKPPPDTVKLADRLFYLLQPSLETVIAEAALEFPCQPFAYQFEGVAFLYPRVAAILADEMGLGKTMQAITAIRLLIACGRDPDQSCSCAPSRW